MADPSSIQMVFVFNHKYERNIEKLAAIYGDRFPDIRYIMPFYRGTRPDVIRVDESSARFQGFFAQAAKSLVDSRFSHYVFIADDLMLHPQLNAGNLLERFGVTEGVGYIKTMSPLSDVPLEWPHLLDALQPFRDDRYVHFKQEIPDASTAASLLARHGLTVGDLTWKNLRGYGGWKRYPKLLHHIRHLARRKGRIPLPYPLIMTYADLVIVPREAIEQFCHLCGVFAAMGLWVEVAIPTALALSCERIMRMADIPGGGNMLEIWSPAEIEALGAKANYELSRLFSVVGDDCIYVHPIKLSKWKP